MIFTEHNLDAQALRLIHADEPGLFPPTRTQRLVAHLLWLANSQPPQDEHCRAVFYSLKDRLCRRYGCRTGTAYQSITHHCWSCGGTGVWNRRRWNADTCWKCGGTGIYRRHWVELETWAIAGRVFHRPVLRWNVEPERVDIVGKITHEVSGPQCDEAALWLSLMFDRRLFWMLLWRGHHPWCDALRLPSIRLRYPLLSLVNLLEFGCNLLAAADRVIRDWHCPYCGSPTWRGDYCGDGCREAHEQEFPF